MKKRDFISCAFLALLIGEVSGDEPDWWTSGPFQIIEAGATPNNFSPANIGQGKHVAWSAIRSLELIDPEIAEAIEYDLVGSGGILPGWTATGSSQEYSPLVIGQLKALSAPFYENLNAVVPAWLSAELSLNQTESGGIYPWTDSVADDVNLGIANLGQLKSVFALHFTDSQDGDVGSDYLEHRYLGTTLFDFDPSRDADGDGINDLDELRSFSNRYLRDVDGDGLSDGEEADLGGSFDPFKRDTDGDGIPDGQTDVDGDLISDQWEEELILNLADPLIDGIEDIGNGPGSDADGDGVSDYQEYQSGMFGHLVDSDGDGYSDRLSIDQEIHIKLDEASGTSANDSSPEGRNGTLTGTPIWQSTGGIVGGALEFGGGTDAVDLPEAVFDGLADVTISLWFKSSSNASSQALISSANSSQAPELAITLEQTMVAGDTIRFDAGGGESFTWVRNRSLADGLWHHVVVVRDFTNSQVTLHLDGVIVSTQTGTLFAALDVDAATLGQEHTGVSTFDPASAFVGLLDDVRAYSSMLASGHALELFQPNDLDADGLPDDYEDSITGNLSTLVSADDDLDGDGLTNRQEFEGGTDPTDYYNGTAPVVNLVSGSGQEVFNGQRTDDPLVFRVTSDGTTPLVGAPVTLAHLGLLGSVETLDGDTLASSLILRTDSNGEVSVHFKAN